MRLPEPGVRVVIRFRDGDGATDALGTVIALEPGPGEDASTVVVDTQRGPVHIARTDILLVHEVPPAPQRAGRPHETVSSADVRRIAANAWLPGDVTWLNADNLRADVQEDAAFVQSGWLLRNAGGASPAADSALPLSTPGVEPVEALELTERWYEQRTRPPAVQIYSEAGSTELAPICAELAGAFRDRGYSPSRAVLALAADTRAVAGDLAGPSEAGLDGLQIVESEDVADVHFAAWERPAGHPHHDEYARLLHGPEQHRFYSAIAHHPDGSRSLVGVVRLAVTNKWAVVSDLVVDPGTRRRGAGRVLVRAAAAAAAGRGIRSMLAEVPSTSAPALELFGSLGAREHHRCWFAEQGG